MYTHRNMRTAVTIAEFEDLGVFCFYFSFEHYLGRLPFEPCRSTPLRAFSNGLTVKSKKRDVQ